jgi:hypothetical protein
MEARCPHRAFPRGPVGAPAAPSWPDADATRHSRLRGVRRRDRVGAVGTNTPGSCLEARVSRRRRARCRQAAGATSGRNARCRRAAIRRGLVGKDFPTWWVASPPPYWAACATLCSGGAERAVERGQHWICSWRPTDHGRIAVLPCKMRRSWEPIAPASDCGSPMLHKDDCQLRAERLFARLADLRAKLLGEQVDCTSPESIAQIERIANFLRGPRDAVTSRGRYAEQRKKSSARPAIIGTSAAASADYALREFA